MLATILLEVLSAKASAAIGAGIVAIGAGLGLGKIGSAAMDAMARQPEAISKIQTPMLIIGAFVEGVALLGIIACILAIVM